MYIDSCCEDDLSMEEVLNRIIVLSDETLDFWQDPRGWAPDSATELLEVARLDWLKDLTHCLRIWIKLERPITQGEILLARANLGALVEGWLKLFYCVYYEDYKSDDRAFRKNGKLINPNNIKFENLKNFGVGILWRGDDRWFKWIDSIQYKRNAIHAFNSRKIGSEEDFYRDIRIFHKFISLINNRFPYPDH